MKRILFRHTALLALLAGLLLWTAPAAAQEEANLPGFGMEFEFAGRGNRVPVWEHQTFENYIRILRSVAEHYGDEASSIRKEHHKTVTRPDGSTRRLWRAIYTDPRGRKWRLEPEYVSSRGLDGYELVTPPLENSNEIREVLSRIHSSGTVREGLKSGVHLHVDGSRLIGPNGNATALINLINMHESFEPLLRRIFNPVRGGGHSNRFATPIYLEHPELLREINELGPRSRTVEKLREIFARYNDAEMRNRGFESLEPAAWEKMWKYHSLNLVNAIDINERLQPEIGTVEFRMFDLDVENPRSHELAADLYRRMVNRAAEMAANGEVFEYTRAFDNDAVPEGESPSRFLLSNSPDRVKREARRLVELVGGDVSRYEPLLERNINRFAAPTETEFEGRLRRLPNGRIEIGGEPMTFGFELEGRGPHVALLMRPRAAELDARWDGMTDAEKIATFESMDKNINRFRMDTEKYPWLSERIHREYTGNWEIESKVFENLDEALRTMRSVRDRMGGDGRGFHMHMRWKPETDVYRANSSEIADWFNRAADAIFLRRLEVMKHVLSMNTEWNRRYDAETIREIEEGIRENLEPWEKARTIAWRPGGEGENRFLDVEIRGLWTRVDDIETVSRTLANAFKNHAWGDSRLEDNMMDLSDRVRGRTLAEHAREYAESVEGRRLSPAEMRIIENFSRHDSPWGRRVTNFLTNSYDANMLTPLLGWENETTLEEPTRRHVRFMREEYLRSVLSTMDRVANGEYGLDINVANREGLRDAGLSAADADRLIAYRNSLSRPGFDINSATLAELTRTPGVGRTTAMRVLDHVAAGNSIDSEGELRAAGVTGRPLEALLGRMSERAAEPRFITNFSELRNSGMSTEGVETLRAEGSMSNIDANRLFRTNRAAVKRWANEAGLSDAMFRSLLPVRGRERSNNRPDFRARELEAMSSRELREAGIRPATIGLIELLRGANRPVTVENLESSPLNLELETARASELARLDGVSRTAANRIVAFRNALRSPPSIDLNTATRTMLRGVPGLNAEAVNRIAAFRDGGGRFTSGASADAAGLEGPARLMARAMLGANPGRLKPEHLRGLTSVPNRAVEDLRERVRSNSRRANAEDVETLMRETNIPMTERTVDAMPSGRGTHALEAEVTAATPSIRAAARNAFPSFHWMSTGGHENLGVHVTAEDRPKVTARINRTGPEITVSTGMLDKLTAATEGMSAEEAKAFRSRALSLLAIEAMDKATSLDLNVAGAARNAGLMEGERISEAELERLKAGFEKAGLELPRTATRLAASSGTTRGNGILSEEHSRENLRRINERSSSGRRGRRGR